MNTSLFKTQSQRKEAQKKQAQAMMSKLNKFVEFQAKPKLTYKELKALNEVDKKDYMNNVLLRDKQMQAHLEMNIKKVEDATDEVVALEMEVLDVKEDWKDEMTKINEHLKKKGIENGISKDEYLKQYKFKEFNLTAAVPRSKCAMCRAGKGCKVHTFKKNQHVTDFDEKEKEAKKTAGRMKF